MVALEEIKPGSRLRGLDPEGVAESHILYPVKSKATAAGVPFDLEQSSITSAYPNDGSSFATASRMAVSSTTRSRNLGK
jgi:hypothetical protein